MGTPEIAIPTFQALIDFPESQVLAVYSQPDRPTGRKKRLTPSPVKAHAESLGIPVKTPEKAKAAEVIEELNHLSPDLIIVCAYGQILPQNLLDIPKTGCFNAHFSFLPRWRGASPVQAAIKAGDSETGVSLQKIVLKLDAGPVVAASSKETIQPDDTYQSLVTRLGVLSGTLLTETLPLLLSQNYPTQVQKEEEATFCRIIKKEEGRINWDSESAIEIERKLRAFTPWPGIFTFDADGKRIQITKLKIVNQQSAPPGVILPEFQVGTRENSLRILALKPEGKQEMSAGEFLRGHPHLIGSHFQN
ncbi:MAG: methionyl-tRNA formyltransferase [SAR324 cluster bacterium]|nr:methionyl-tRNA formyltransferase [SAR324 cluster bacterium]